MREMTPVEQPAPRTPGRRGLVRAVALMAAGIAVSAAGYGSPQSATPTMPLSELRAGMRGEGYTVVRGTEPERFSFEILGILENTFPKQSLIVARLSGLGLEDAGIAAGMSGSPAYVDGRLIGAVSYRMGSFPKEPVAGITPIENMLRIEGAERPRDVAGTAAPSSARMLLAAADLMRGEAADLGALQPASTAGGIVPIATPVTLGGFDPEVVRRVLPMFQSMGWRASVGGTSQNPSLRGPLRAGSAVAAQLMRGDVTFTATGTVTWVEGDRLLAFGHPFLQAGSVDFPMAAAEVLTVLPSVADSQKLTAAGTEVLGAIRQDRQAGIFGVVGTSPPMVPVTVNVAGEGFDERFDFEMVADKSLSPTFLFLGLSNGLQSVGALSGDSAVEVKGEFRLDPRYEPVRIENRFSSSIQAFFPMAQTITAVYQFLYENPFEPVEVRSVALDVTLRDDLRVAEITRVWADRTDVRPGEVVRLAVWLKPYRQPEVEIGVDVRLPADLAEGAVSVLVADGGVVAADERSAGRGAVQPQSVEQLIGQLNEARPSDRIYYQVSRPGAGAVYGGRAMPSLPPSILDVLSAGSTSGESEPLSKVVISEGSEQVEYVVSGEHRIELNVRRR